MTIGLDGSRAFLRYRTGIEEYSYQVIKHLRDVLPREAEVRVYVRKKIVFKNGKFGWQFPVIDFSLPENWTVIGLWAPRFWTQIRLSLKMLLYPVDALFIPAHTVPIIHPKNTTVVVHGLEYEMSPESYTPWERFYMRTSIRYSARAAKKVVSVSENTKRDLIRLYKVPAEKITVIYEGFIKSAQKESGRKDSILFIGRLEERKNVNRILQAFEILKDRYNLSHRLVLAGKPGYRYEKISEQIKRSRYRNHILEKGYISQEEKEKLLSEAEAFIFPSLYEGFGLPILEAQSFGVPVITSNVSSLPEVAGDGALYANPLESADIAEKLYQILSLKPEEKRVLIEKGYGNLERFSWAKCAQEVSRALVI